ncbi:MAG: hypothetical protein D6785_12010 [Planctomycetota bacterium]|nr:MAG: hypothetical protein D6785_12010 [Planctomycetota bacterium]
MNRKETALTMFAVCSAVLLVISLGAAVIFNAELKRIQSRKAEISKRLKQLKEETSNFSNELIDVNKLLIGSETESAEVEQYVKNFTEGRDAFAKFIGNKNYVEHYSTLMDLYSDLALEVIFWRLQYEQKQVDTQLVDQDLSSKDRSFSEIQSRKEEGVELMDLSTNQPLAEGKVGGIRNLKEEIKRIEDDIRQKTMELDENITDMNKNYENAQKRLSSLKDEYEQKFIPKLKTEIANRRRKIQELKEKIRERKTLLDLEPNGEIIQANHVLGYVWINLGRMHGLRKGFIFKVFQYSKGGVRDFKGKIEVIKTDVRLSQCRILSSYYRNNPLVRGDYIFNPFFSRNKRVNVVFAGDKPFNRLYRLSQYQRWIRNLDQIVSDKVNNRTDFLIFLQDYQNRKEFEDAKNFPWIIFMKESEFLDYMLK